MAGAKPGPLTSTPAAVSCLMASLTMSLVHDVSSGALVSTVAPSRFFVPVAVATIRSHAAVSRTPTPPAAGQMSLFTSFICHSWWLAPSSEPLLTTRSAHAWALSRQYAQPCSAPRTKAIAFTAVRRVGETGLVGPDGVLAHADALGLVGDDVGAPPGVYSSPVSGLTASSTCAYSL